MNTHRLKLARRPAPSGRVAHSARVLPARDSIARRIEPEWFAVRGFTVPVRYARPDSPPTAGNHRIRDEAMTGMESKSSRLWLRRSRNFRATVTRYPRNDHRCKCYLQGLSAFANFPRSFHVYGLNTVFPQSRIVSIHALSEITNQSRSVHCLSEKHPRSGHWFPCQHYAQCLNGFITVPVFEWRLPLARVVCVQTFRSSVAASQLLSCRRAVLFAFSVASLASSKARPNLSRGVWLSGVVGLLYRHSGRRAGLQFVSFAQLSGIHVLAVVALRLVCPLRQRRSVAAIQRVPTFAQSDSERE
jgi:hypothetical protein